MSSCSGKDSTRKSSSSSPSAASKSSRKKSSDQKNSKESSNEGSSFWSSFLGDSVSSDTFKAESKTSSHRVSGKKLGLRVSGGNTGSSDDRNQLNSANSTKEKENISSRKSLKQDEKQDVNVTDSAKSESNLEAPHILTSEKESTTNYSKDLSNQEKNVSDSANSTEVENAGLEKAEFSSTHELSVAPVKINESKEKSESLKLSSSGKSEVITPGNDEFQGQINASMQDSSAVKNSEVSKEKRAAAPHKEPGSLLEGESKSPNSDTVHSFQKEKLKQSQHPVENTLDTTHSHKLSSRAGFSNVAGESVSSDLDGLSVIDPTDNAVIPAKTGHEIQQEPAEQNKFLDVKPLASSTPNHCVKKRDRQAKTKLTHSQPTSENKEGLNQNELESSATGIKDTISENVAEVFMEAVSFVEDKQLPQGIPKQDFKEPACVGSDDKNAVNQLTVQQANTNILGKF